MKRVVVFVLLSFTLVTSSSRALEYRLRDLRISSFHSDAQKINSMGNIIGIYDKIDDLNKYYAYMLDSELEFIDIGCLGTGSSGAYGINDIGQVVGYYDNIPDGPPIAMIWSRDIGIQSIGAFGNKSAIMRDINNSGMACGSYKDTNNNMHPYIWNMTEGKTDLHLLSGGQSAEAKVINDNNWVAGWSDSTNGSHACVWMPDGELLDIAQGQVNAINNSNNLAIRDFTKSKSYFWSEGGGLLDIGSLSPGATTSVWDMNNSDYIVGSCTHVLGYQGLGFVWSKQTGMIPLYPLPGDFYSEALGINDSGYIVGTSWGGNGHRAVLWEPFPEFSLADLENCLRWYAGLAEMPVQEDSLPRYDAVRNGRIDMVDITTIARIIFNP